jgi:predicted glycoside hydrolase/deacetylase ChbG (UPF0249 family)
MITMPYAAESIVMVQREAEEMGLGLHLNLTAGSPLTPPEYVPALVDANGHFRHKTALTPSLSTLDMGQVERELRAQVERFIAVKGGPPDHLDSHHHITYLDPEIFSLMLRLAIDFSVPIRFPFLTNLKSVLPWMLQWGVADTETALESMISDLVDEIDHSGVLAPDHAVGTFYGDHITLGDLLLILTSLPEGVSEIMCHPGLVDGVLRAASGYAEEREAELQALTHPSAREVIEAEDIELITFANLGS